MALFAIERAEGQNCSCDSLNTIILVDEEIDSDSYSFAAGDSVCFEGSGTFVGTLNFAGDFTLCIDEGITFEVSSDFTTPDSTNWGQIWSGNWVINNYGKFVGNTVITIQDGQVFNNYSFGDYDTYGDADSDLCIEAGFYIPPDIPPGEDCEDYEDVHESNDQLNIEEGGVFNNYGSINVSGDFVNNGEFNSDENAIINVGNEFHNESGDADFYSLRAYGEITNTGEITLRGIIESVTDGFRNARDGESGTVKGIGSPCVIIRTATFIENNGDDSVLDGELGTIVLDSRDRNYDRSGDENPEVYAVGQADQVNISEACLAVLPVVWQGLHVDYFSGSGKGVNVYWSTLKEWETSHYEVERSIDGVDDFKPIGRVDAVGWSDIIVHYEFVDNELPFIAKRLYYRLKQVDLDGSYTYSETLMVALPEVKVSKGVWKVYPNPLDGKSVRIALMDEDFYQDEVIYFRVFNPISSSLYKAAASLGQLEILVPAELNNFSSGLVVLEIRWAEHVEYIKVIK